MFSNQHQGPSFAENAIGVTCPSHSNHPTSWAEDEGKKRMEDVGDAFHFKDEDIHYNPQLHPATELIVLHPTCQPI